MTLTEQMELANKAQAELDAKVKADAKAAKAKAIADEKARKEKAAHDAEQAKKNAPYLKKAAEEKEMDDFINS